MLRERENVVQFWLQQHQTEVRVQIGRAVLFGCGQYFFYNAAGCRIGMDDRRTNALKTLIYPHSYEGSNLFLAVDPCLRRNDGSVHR